MPIIPQLFNGDIFQHMLSKRSETVKITSDDQKKFLLEFLLNKVQQVDKPIPVETIKDLQLSVASFFSNFKKKFNSTKTSQKVEKILKDKNWCQVQFSFPKSTIQLFEDEPTDHLDETIRFDPDKSTKVFGNTSTSGQVTFSHLELCQVMKHNDFAFTDKKSQLKSLRTLIRSKLPFAMDELEELMTDLDEKIRLFLVEAVTIYQQVARDFPRFLKTNFVSKNFELPPELKEYIETSYFRASTEIRGSGRKLLPFGEKSKRAQQYASAEVRKKHEPGAIILAVSQQRTELGLLVKKSNSQRGVTVKKALNAIASPERQQASMKKPIEALAFMLTNKMTKEQYNNLKAACKENQADIWPNYNKVLEAKQECRPEGIVVTELSAHVPLQNLMDHTARRILGDAGMVERMKRLAEDNLGELDIILYFKFGMDGCGSFDTFMQKDQSGIVPDGSTLLTSQMVPLQAVAFVATEPVIIHHSRTPNNANSCRPIRLCFERETKETIQKEADRLRGEVDSLSDLLLSDNPKITVIYRGLFTMIDGKVLNELTKNKSSQCCAVCHATSREMSNPNGDFVPRPGALQYGISILHFGLRCFDLLCQIGYNQDVRKYNIRKTDGEKEIIKQRERKVKAEFREKLGLIVDQRRDGGAGNTTDGNVVRKAFANHSVTALILGISGDLVENLGLIWSTLASGYAIDPEKFGKLCHETHEMYLDDKNGTSWHNITPTLHKVLVHGQELVEHCPLPIGLTNEEAGEGNNKILRHVRLHHTRKTSWLDGMSDLFHRMMDASDPIILETTNGPKRKSGHRNGPLSQKITNLLLSPIIAVQCQDNEM